MTGRLMLPGAFVWDVAALAGRSLDDLAELVMLGRPFGIEVDADRCAVMWGQRWARLWCQPHPTPFGPGWSIHPALYQSPNHLPLGGVTAAARGEAPKADDGAPQEHLTLTISSINLSLTTVTASPAVPLHPPCGQAVRALGIGVDDCFAEGLTWG